LEEHVWFARDAISLFHDKYVSGEEPGAAYNRERAEGVLFSKLCNGEFPAIGSFSNVRHQSEEVQSDDWVDFLWESPGRNELVPIKPEFWVPRGVAWQYNRAKSPDGEFFEIQVSTDALLQQFPPPPALEKLVEVRGDYFLLPVEGNSKPVVRRNRKAKYDWPSFMAEGG
jgi:hypothetical protein